MSTKEKLADRLATVGLIELSDRARKGEFSDFESPHATPKVILVRELFKFPFPEATAIRQEIIDGKWDDTNEEAEAWRKSPDGQEAIEKLLGRGKR